MLNEYNAPVFPTNCTRNRLQLVATSNEIPSTEHLISSNSTSPHFLRLTKKGTTKSIANHSNYLLLVLFHQHIIKVIDKVIPSNSENYTIACPPCFNFSRM